MKNIRKIQIAVVALMVLIGGLIFWQMNFSARHYVGLGILRSYPKAVEIIRRNRGIIASMGGEDFEVAPTFKTLGDVFTKSDPYDLMEIEVRRGEKEGTAKVSCYPGSFSCLIQWHFQRQPEL